MTDPIKYMQLPSEVRHIIHRVAKDEEVRVTDIMSPKKGPHRISDARHKAMAEIRSIPNDNGKPKFSLPEIGDFMGRHHTSCLYAIRKEVARMKKSKKMAKSYAKPRDKILA